EPCPDLDEDAADMRPERITRDPTVLPERRPVPDLQALPIESIWVEPGRSSDARGTAYVPPRLVRQFLEAPTAERAPAYLSWNQQRLDAVARAAEVLSAVASAQPPRNPTVLGTTPAPTTCVAPAESGSLQEPRSPEPGPRAAMPPPSDRRLAG